MYVFPAKKFQITSPGSVTFTSFAWMLNRGYVAVGGTNGVLRVMILNLDNEKTIASVMNPWTSTQHLEGHNGGAQVRLLCWNEVYQKLASCDDNGLIIVWMNHGTDESWCEEMLNNRHKSNVVSLKWSNDGSKIAIAYEDGQLITGLVDGNRLWIKDTNSKLVKITWSADDSLLILGLADGEVHAYDQNGNFLMKISMLCVENVEMETALSKDLKKDMIVSMEWYAPTKPCKISFNRRLMEKNGSAGGGGSLIFPPRMSRQDTSADEPYVFRGQVPEDRPRFLVAYQNGSIQLMCNESSMKNVCIIRLPSTIIVAAQWAPDGSMFAVAGYQTDLPEAERNVLHFISAYGVRLQSIRLAEGQLVSIAWESSGLQLAVLIDTNIFLVVVKHAYKWGYCGQTLVYSYKCAKTLQETLVFYETKMEVKTKRFLENVCAIRTFGDYCAVIFRTDELRGAYTMQVCDSIGTPVDSQTTSVTPDFVEMNGDCVVAASVDCFTVWHYVLPRKAAVFVGGGGATLGGSNSGGGGVSGESKLYYIDQHREVSDEDVVRRSGRTVDSICAVCVGPNFFLIGRESGTMHRYRLPDVQQQYVFKVGIPPARQLSLNCAGNRLALINRHWTLKFYTVADPTQMVVVPGFERKDVWNVEWDMEKDDTLAVMEKSRLVVIRGIDAEEPISNAGWICQFRDLTVRTVLLDEVFKWPEQVNKFQFVDIEIRVLKQIKDLIHANKIQEAIGLIEKNNHPKLWDILANAALKKLDWQMAEHAFVKLQDYNGIQFLKRLRNIQSDALKRAEVCVFLGDLEAAEKIYFENDRRDLVVDMLKKMYDWFRIQQILQTSHGPGDDLLVQQVWRHVGDYYMERQKWKSAARYYEHSNNYAELVYCYLMTDDFEQLEAVSRQVPDGHDVLKELAEIFTHYGLCEQAIDCYMRCGQVGEAFETCVRLNKWDRAAELSDRFQLADVSAMLSNYASQITATKTKGLAIAQLYRKAAKFLEAAKIVFEIADDEHQRQASPLRLKKLYVMAALLVEEYHHQNQQRLARCKGESAASATTALEELLSEDQTLSVDDTRLIDGAWRRAEAYHFFMLAHKQLYQGNYEAAMKTTLTVVDYEDVLDPLEVYSFLALTSYIAGYYGVCSKAFMKLEALPGLSADDEEAYANLALQIFLKFPPKDDRPTRVECTSCDTPIADHVLVCPNLACGTRFPVCVASGRPLYDYQFWLCPSCKHRAYEREIQSWKFCPLCHFDISE